MDFKGYFFKKGTITIGFDADEFKKIEYVWEIGMVNKIEKQVNEQALQTVSLKGLRFFSNLTGLYIKNRHVVDCGELKIIGNTLMKFILRIVLLTYRCMNYAV